MGGYGQKIGYGRHEVPDASSINFSNRPDSNPSGPQKGAGDPGGGSTPPVVIKPMTPYTPSAPTVDTPTPPGGRQGKYRGGTGIHYLPPQPGDPDYVEPPKDEINFPTGHRAAHSSTPEEGGDIPAADSSGDSTPPADNPAPAARPAPVSPEEQHERIQQAQQDRLNQLRRGRKTGGGGIH